MTELAKKIRSEMKSRGPIPFRDFMDMALYCLVYGYYEKEADKIGRKGDFYTSVSVGPLFGRLLAFQFAQWLEIEPKVQNPESKVERPPCLLIESGAHDGTLAKDILNWFREYRPSLFNLLEYWIIEPSAMRRERQRKTLDSFASKLHWFDSFASCGTQGGECGVEGIIFSNELLDAMPVHRLGWDAKNRRWFEWGVQWQNDRFAWTPLEEVNPVALALAPEIPETLASVLPEGFTVEVPVAAVEWWRAAARVLRRGKLVALDYGMEEDELLAPERGGGTLRGYHRHRAVADVLANPGEQDITSHVNFTLLKQAGESLGLVTEPLRTQARFLTSILSDATRPGSGFGSFADNDARQFQSLTHPEHLGRAFRVLVQGRNK